MEPETRAASTAEAVLHGLRVIEFPAFIAAPLGGLTLAQLGATPATRRIAVLGSMKELGDFAPSFHSQLAEPLAEAHVDYAILVGEEMVALVRELGTAANNTLGNAVAYAHCQNPGEAIAALEEFGLTGGDAVLVKGSNSVGLGLVVAHFAAREG